MAKIGISFGAGNIGEAKSESWKTIMGGGASIKGDDFKDVLNYLVKNDIYDLDTAYIYGAGSSEEEIGSYIPKISIEKSGKNWFIATKAHPQFGLTKQGVQDQLNTSLKRLNVKSVDIFYLHFPDAKVNLEETLEGVNILYKEGKFKEFGLSNFLAFQISQVYYISKAKGWVLPTVYQGPYNLLARKVEDEIFAALDMFKIRFYAYSPLAGGLLARPLASFDKIPDDSRFTGVFGQIYWKKELFAFLEKVNDEAKKNDINLRQVALSWLVHHSKLNVKRGDKIILGASSLKQLQTSVDEIWGAKELPSSVLDVIKAGTQGVDASPSQSIVQPVGVGAL